MKETQRGIKREEIRCIHHTLAMCTLVRTKQVEKTKQSSFSPLFIPHNKGKRFIYFFALAYDGMAMKKKKTTKYKETRKKNSRKKNNSNGSCMYYALSYENVLFMSVNSFFFLLLFS